MQKKKDENVIIKHTILNNKNILKPIKLCMWLTLDSTVTDALILYRLELYLANQSQLYNFARIEKKCSNR
jgi:hypothetical protein